jgi:hypothetical protein
MVKVLAGALSPGSGVGSDTTAGDTPPHPPSRQRERHRNIKLKDISLPKDIVLLQECSFMVRNSLHIANPPHISVVIVANVLSILYNSNNSTPYA